MISNSLIYRINHFFLFVILIDNICIFRNKGTSLIITINIIGNLTVLHRCRIIYGSNLRAKFKSIKCCICMKLNIL